MPLDPEAVFRGLSRLFSLLKSSYRVPLACLGCMWALSDALPIPMLRQDVHKVIKNVSLCTRVADEALVDRFVS